MDKKLGIGILTVNAVYACGCLKDKIKESVIEDFKKKIKEEDEKQIKKIKGFLIGGAEVISHSNTLNSDEFLKSNVLVLEKATDNDKKKIKEIFEKNIKQIKSKAQYGENSVFVFSSVSHDKMDSYVIFEFDKSKINPLFNVDYITLKDFDEKFKFEKLFK